MKVSTNNGPRKVTFRIILKSSNFLLPRHSARNFVPEVPKKFVTKVVINKQKLRETFIEPSVSFPKVLAIKKLNANGTKPTNARAIPVKNEFLIRRRFSVLLLDFLNSFPVKI